MTNLFYQLQIIFRKQYFSSFFSITIFCITGVLLVNLAVCYYVVEKKQFSFKNGFYGILLSIVPLFFLCKVLLTINTLHKTKSNFVTPSIYVIIASLVIFSTFIALLFLLTSVLAPWIALFFLLQVFSIGPISFFIFYFTLYPPIVKKILPLAKSPAYRTFHIAISLLFNLVILQVSGTYL